VLGTSGVSGSGNGSTTATAGTGVGTAAITAGVGTLTASNYDFTTLTDGTLTIGKAPLSVTANADSKTYDGVAYVGGNGVSYSGFVNSEGGGVLGGTLSYGGTSQGAIVTGNYAITPNGLSSGNYTLTFFDGTLTINPGPTPTPTSVPTPRPPVVPSPSFPIPNGAPPLREFVSSIPVTVTDSVPDALPDGGITISRVQSPAEPNAEVIAVSVPNRIVAAGNGFAFALPSEAFDDEPDNSVISVSLPDGAALPTWLRFVRKTRLFLASAVPDGALPVQVIVTVGKKRLVVVISVRQE